jgi:hypothetical protein
MPVALANNRQLKIFTIVTPKGHDMQIDILVEIIRGFGRPGILRTKHKQFGRELPTDDESKMAGQAIIAVSPLRLVERLYLKLSAHFQTHVCTE